MRVERLIVLAPIDPAPTGNGLAMRTELFRSAASEGFEALTVVVPAAGRLPGVAGTRQRVVTVPIEPAVARAGVRELLQDSVWRERLAGAGRLPSLARAASPGLADAVVEACGGTGTVGLHVMRSYLAPLGIAVAQRLRAAWVTLDLDEDDAQFARSNGQEAEAEAYARTLRVFSPLFDGLSAASKDEGVAMAERWAVAIEHLPNAVRVLQVPGRSRRLPAGRRTLAERSEPLTLLLVGNLTYAPNAEAARVLVQEILPRVRNEVASRARDAMVSRVRVRLVGSHRPELLALAGEDVELMGFVPHLSPIYAAADIVLAPLGIAAGTRIKLLEAFAHGVPVVASPAAAAGLDVADGRHLLIAAGPERAAEAIARLVRDRDLASRLAAEARALVDERYSTEVVIPRIRDFFASAAARAQERSQLSAPA